MAGVLRAKDNPVVFFDITIGKKIIFLRRFQYSKLEFLFSLVAIRSHHCLNLVMFQRRSQSWTDQNGIIQGRMPKDSRKLQTNVHRRV